MLNLTRIYKVFCSKSPIRPFLSNFGKIGVLVMKDIDLARFAMSLRELTVARVAIRIFAMLKFNVEIDLIAIRIIKNQVFYHLYNNQRMQLADMVLLI